MRGWSNLMADPESISPLPGVDESVAAARIRIGGHEVVGVWCRFEVAAGTLSVAAGRRFAEALDHAVEHGLPVVAVANSGGARMQEGTRAFVQMIEVTAAVRRLHRAGLALIVYLAHPTTGGVFASWASLGDVTFAEPGATIGFTGPRVAEAIGERIEPASSQRAEGLLHNGLVDAVVAVDDLRARVANVLHALAPVDPVPVDRPARVAEGPSGWAAVVSSRRPDRPVVIDEVRFRASAFVELSGDRCGTVDGAVVAGLCRIDGRRFVVIAHAHAGARPTAGGLRTARRAMGIAERLGLPVVTVIDTGGAIISGEQEREGFAGEIARSIDAMLGLTVPSLAVVAGQGSGGAAVAWMAANRVIAASDAWVAPIAPEAASVIVDRTPDHAAQLADRQQVGAIELRANGIVSAVYAVVDLVDALLVTLDEL